MSETKVKKNRSGSASYPGGARYGRTSRPGDDIERDAPNESPGFEDERETTGRSLKRNPRTTRPGLEE